jgi:heme o synthase
MPPAQVATPVALVGSRAPLDTVAAVFALAKPRLAAMSVLTTMAAYATAPAQAAHTGATLAGTSLAAAGALSLNQWWERDADALMARTRGRPLPCSRLTAREALAWSLGFSLGGVVLLAGWVNVTAAAIAAATIVVYGVVYTPLKRRTRWATEVGAISGALPALLGNAAAGDVLSRPGLVLTLILLLWQMPHFFAIGWRHRDDYRTAGFKLLPAVDPTGRQTAAWSLGYACALLGVSLVPCALGWCGVAYGAIVGVAGCWFVRHAWQFVIAVDRERAARSFFLGSLFYLPVAIAALLVERLLL